MPDSGITKLGVDSGRIISVCVGTGVKTGFADVKRGNRISGDPSE